MNHNKALRAVLLSLDGPAHHIRELQATRGLPDNPIDFLITEYNAKAGQPEPVAYPISHGSHIIQYHDETFVWYDEAGLQGGVEYSLEQAQTALKRYGEWLNSTAPALQPITQPGYAPGEIPHHVGDLTDYAVKQQKQIIDLWVVMAQARELLSMTQRHVKNPTLEKAIEAFLAMTAAPADPCKTLRLPTSAPSEAKSD